jgi:hypothetical protein
MYRHLMSRGPGGIRVEVLDGHIGTGQNHTAGIGHCVQNLTCGHLCSRWNGKQQTQNGYRTQVLEVARHIRRSFLSWKLFRENDVLLCGASQPDTQSLALQSVTHFAFCLFCKTKSMGKTRHVQ